MNASAQKKPPNRDEEKAKRAREGKSDLEQRDSRYRGNDTTDDDVEQGDDRAGSPPAADR